MSDELEADRREDARFERQLFWREIAVVLLIAGLIVVREVLGG